jgi:general secretion pathway protein M
VTTGADSAKSLRERPALRCLVSWSLALLVPLALVLAIGIPWWQKLRGLNEQIAREGDQILRYRQVLATLPSLKAALAEEKAKDDYKAFYFDAATSALAGAQLQTDVQEMVRAAGARPISTQVLPVNADEQPLRVRIRTQFQGDTEALLDILFRVDQARPFLFVDQMSIRSTTPRTRPSRRTSRRPVRRASPRSQVGELTVRLDVFGYVLGGGE